MITASKEKRFKVLFDGKQFYNVASTGLVALQRIHAKLLSEDAARVKSERETIIVGEHPEIDIRLASFATFKALSSVQESLRY